MEVFYEIFSKQHDMWFCQKIADGPQFMTVLTRNVQNCCSNAGEHHQLSRGIWRFVVIGGTQTHAGIYLDD
jgi:hypothetical protein